MCDITGVGTKMLLPLKQTNKQTKVFSPLKLLASGDGVNSGSFVPIAVKLILTRGALLNLSSVSFIKLVRIRCNHDYDQ